MTDRDPDAPDRCPRCDRKNWSGDLCGRCQEEDAQRLIATLIAQAIPAVRLAREAVARVNEAIDRLDDVDQYAWAIAHLRDLEQALDTDQQLTLLELPA